MMQRSLRRNDRNHRPMLHARLVAAVCIFALGAIATSVGARAATIDLGPGKVRVERVEKHHSAPARSRGSRAVRGIFGVPIACPVVRGGLVDVYWEGLDHTPRFARPVGYSNDTSGGRPRCREGKSSTYVTRLRFPVNLVPTEAEIVSAKLSYTESDTNAHEGRPPDPLRCQTVTRVVAMNTVGFRKGRHTLDQHRRLYMPFLPFNRWVPNAHRGDTIEVDATQWVRMWHSGAENHGISVYGRDFDYDKNNRACIADIGQEPIRLTIEYE